jgi:hypothetical protein
LREKVDQSIPNSGQSARSFITFEACCGHALEFSRHVGTFTNDRRPDGRVETAPIVIIETAHDLSKSDEIYALLAHIEAFADRTRTGDIAKTYWTF